jgi:hypothetical protein
MINVNKLKIGTIIDYKGINREVGEAEIKIKVYNTYFKKFEFSNVKRFYVYVQNEKEFFLKDNEIIVN